MPAAVSNGLLRDWVARVLLRKFEIWKRRRHLTQTLTTCSLRRRLGPRIETERAHDLRHVLLNALFGRGLDPEGLAHLLGQFDVLVKVELVLPEELTQVALEGTPAVDVADEPDTRREADEYATDDQSRELVLDLTPERPGLQNEPGGQEEEAYDNLDLVEDVVAQRTQGPLPDTEELANQMARASEHDRVGEQEEAYENAGEPNDNQLRCRTHEWIEEASAWWIAALTPSPSAAGGLASEYVEDGILEEIPAAVMVSRVRARLGDKTGIATQKRP